MIQCRKRTEMLSQGYILALRYVIIRCSIIQGGMGIVYQAWDQRLNALVIVKENRYREADMKIAFWREAQILANLSHPALPHVIDYFCEDGKQFLVMEVIEGEDLSSLLSVPATRFTVAQVEEWAKQLLEVLEYLHGQRTPILHRDIKPANIRIRNNRIVLLDFGVAYGQIGKMPVILPEQFNWSGHSDKYSSLEQLNFHHTTPASDLYSSAATIYALLNGSPPINPQDRAKMIKDHRVDPLKDIGDVRPDLDWHFSRTIMQALELEMRRRPQSAVEMRQRMFPEPTLKPRPRNSHKRLVTILCVGALLLGIVIGLILPGRITNFHWRQSRLLSIPATHDAAQPKTPDHVETSPVERAALLAAEAAKLSHAGRYTEAIEKALTALDLAPNDAYVNFVYGDALWDASEELPGSNPQNKTYIEVANKILRLNLTPQTGREYTARAWAYLAIGNKELAFADANRAHKLDPSCIEALLVRATANTDPKSSLNDYKTVINSRPDDVQALTNRAETYLQLDKKKEAIEDYGRAISVIPLESFYEKRGLVYTAMNEFDSAIQDFTAAINYHPDNYLFYGRRANAYFLWGKWDEAIKDDTFVIEHVPAGASKDRNFALDQRAKAYSEARKERQAEADRGIMDRLD